MKIYNKGGDRIVEYNFDSMPQFVGYIKASQTSSKFSHRKLESQIITNQVGEISFQSAVALCENGWNGSYDQPLKITKKIDEKYFFPTKRNKVVRDLYGFSPCVPAYLKGEMRAMWNVKPYYVHDCINIFVNLVCKNSTTAKQIYNRGIFVLGLIDALQKEGYGVNLQAFHASSVYNEILLAYFHLKKEGNVSNHKTMYFPLCSSDFVRRLVFRLIEVAPLNNSWSVSYGRPLPSKVVENLLKTSKTDIIIPEPSEIGIEGKNVDDDLDAFLRYIKFEQYISKRPK